MRNEKEKSKNLFYGNEINKNIQYHYYISIMQLKKLLDSKQKVTCKVWNKIAKENKYLSTESMKYISGKNFDGICRDIKRIIEKM